MHAEVLCVLQETVQITHTRIHHTPDAPIAAYYMTLNTAETKGKDPIQENKDPQINLDPEVIPDPDILNHQKIIDINPNIEVMTIKII